MNARSENVMLAAALSYIERGWPVFPLWNVLRQPDGTYICACPKGAVCADAGKHPFPAYAPNGLHDATLDRADVERIWGNRPELNIGIPTGRATRTRKTASLEL
jgi:hypothetical protein